MAAMGFVALRIIGKRELYSILDHQTGTTRTYTGSISDERVDVHEESTNTYLSGDLAGESFILHDYHTRTYLELMVVGEHFHIKDEAVNKVYEGQVQDVEVAIYDYNTKKHHRYSFNWAQ